MISSPICLSNLARPRSRRSRVLALVCAASLLAQSLAPGLQATILAQDDNRGELAQRVAGIVREEKEKKLVPTKTLEELQREAEECACLPEKRAPGSAREPLPREAMPLLPERLYRPEPVRSENPKNLWALREQLQNELEAKRAQGRQRPAGAKFSAIPTENEIARARVFSGSLRLAQSTESLGKRGAAGSQVSSPEERKALAEVLSAAEARTERGGFEGLEQFARNYPNSLWRASALVLAAQERRATGWFFQAGQAWEEAWKTLIETPQPDAALERQILSGLLDYYREMCRIEDLRRTIALVESRQPSGNLAQKLSQAREALWYLENDSDAMLLCGPLALLALDEKLSFDLDDVFGDRPRTDNPSRGMSLLGLRILAEGVGKKMEILFSPALEEIPYPSIVHWDFEHYAAILTESEGRYLVVDKTMKFRGWISREAIDAQTSRYFLVPVEGAKAFRGLVPVLDKKAAELYGRCELRAHDPNQTTPCDPTTGGSCGAPGMAVASMHIAAASLAIRDTPLAYSPPLGPEVAFKIFYNQRESEQPDIEDMKFGNLGARWTYGWLSYVMSEDTVATAPASVGIYLPGGGAEYYEYDSGTGDYNIDQKSFAQLERIDAGYYERLLSNGSKLVYNDYVTTSPEVGQRVFLSQIIDSAGNALTLSYEDVVDTMPEPDVTVGIRLSTITDAMGKVTTVYYKAPDYVTDPIDCFRIAYVVDAFSAVPDPTNIMTPAEPGDDLVILEYNLDNRLSKIYDTVGIYSEFIYASEGDDADFIVQMNTPYGQHEFSKREASTAGSLIRWIQIEDPMDGRERVEFMQPIDTFTDAESWSEIPGDSQAAHQTPVRDIDISLFDGTGDETKEFVVANFGLQNRNTLYWDKQAMRLSGDEPDPLKAMRYTWAIHPGFEGKGVPVGVKKPLERRVWVNYPGQLEAGRADYAYDSRLPTAIARKIDSGTQLVQIEYNDLGRLTKITDPYKRQTLFNYHANNIDLLTVEQVVSTGTELLATATYNAAHQPLTIIDATGVESSIAYNAEGQVTEIENPQGDVLTFEYYSDLEAIQTDDTLPAAPIDSAKDYGYLIRVTDTSGTEDRWVTFHYDAYGRVETVTDFEGYELKYSYDNLNRVVEILFPDDTTIQYDYEWIEPDEVDPTNPQPENIARRLGPTRVTDRLGRSSEIYYNARGQVAATRDPAEQITQYFWCRCGSLSKLVDPEGQVTQWEYDLQGRPSLKTYADGTQESWEYDEFGRLVLTTDERGQETTYSYYLDGSLHEVDYDNEAAAETPGAELFYENYYPRVSSIENDLGNINFTYNPIPEEIPMSPDYGAGRLASMSGPWPDSEMTVEYDDALGRVTQTTMQSVWEMSGLATTTYSYDAYRRLNQMTNPLGTFTFAWDGETSRLASMTSSHGHEVALAYKPTTNEDFRLDSITNKKPGGSTVSSYSYNYRPDGMITDWTQFADFGSSKTITSVYDFEYDNADRLLDVSRSKTPSMAFGDWGPGEEFHYTYDRAGNRLSEQIITGLTASVTNTVEMHALGAGNVNQLASVDGDGGLIRLRGAIEDEAASVTATVGMVEENMVVEKAEGDDYRFSGYVDLPTGTSEVVINATDLASNSIAPQTYDIDVDAGSDRELIYDGNGNLSVQYIEGGAGVMGGKTWTYAYDANDRLVEVRCDDGASTKSAELSYDAFGRWSKIVKKTDAGMGAATDSESLYVWRGLALAQERTTESMTLSVRDFYPQGERHDVNGSPTTYLYARDHLGSVRQLLETDGDIAAHYEYDPFGRRTALDASGATTATLSLTPMGFTGHFTLQVGADPLEDVLVLAPYRAYDPNTGRWITRDPIKENGGLNLYAYVRNNPVNLIDPMGLFDMGMPGDFGATADIDIPPSINIAAAINRINSNISKYEELLSAGLVPNSYKVMNDDLCRLKGVSAALSFLNENERVRQKTGWDLFQKGRNGIRFITGQPYQYSDGHYNNGYIYVDLVSIQALPSVFQDQFFLEEGDHYVYHQQTSKLTMACENATEFFGGNRAPHEIRADRNEAAYLLINQLSSGFTKEELWEKKLLEGPSGFVPATSCQCP
jgi:RHS repeat-associated protein